MEMLFMLMVASLMDISTQSNMPCTLSVWLVTGRIIILLFDKMLSQLVILSNFGTVNVSLQHSHTSYSTGLRSGELGGLF